MRIESKLLLFSSNMHKKNNLFNKRIVSKGRHIVCRSDDRDLYVPAPRIDFSLFFNIILGDTSVFIQFEGSDVILRHLTGFSKKNPYCDPIQQTIKPRVTFFNLSGRSYRGP